MSVALLDVNVLLALLDADHADHERADVWAEQGLESGWATCALTQNGFVRILAQPTYPNAVPATAAVDLLRAATADDRHVFWPCDVALTDGMIRSDQVLGPRQITDVYLLALAVAHDGRFVTLDRGIDHTLVRGASAAHLHVLS